MSLALALVMLIFLISAQQWRLFERGWFAWREGQQSQQGREHSLWLTDYRVVVEAQPLLGLDEVSGLAFDPDRNSLFAVTNTNDALVELSLTGQVLRSIPLQGFGDAEAVEYISPGIYVISDERRQRLYGVPGWILSGIATLSTTQIEAWTDCVGYSAFCPAPCWNAAPRPSSCGCASTRWTAAKPWPIWPP